MTADVFTHLQRQGLPKRRVQPIAAGRTHRMLRRGIFQSGRSWGEAENPMMAVV
jgi:hypothetical protein